MNTKKRLLTQTGILAAGAMLAAFLLAPNARANPVEIGFNGAGGTGHALLNVVPDTTAGDPSGAQLVMGASGSFSNSAFGTVSITGVRARNFATPFDVADGTWQPGMLPFPAEARREWQHTGVRARNFATPFDVADGTWQPGMLPFPASFSQLAASGTSAQDNGVITYDDLFYADGSPQTCWDYPFFGGFLDPYGVMFSLSNGGFLDLWSFGVVPPDFFGPGSGGLTYGMAVLELTSDGGYAVLPGPPFATASVPEPDLLWLFGAAMLGLFAWRRSVEKKRARIAV